MATTVRKLTAAEVRGLTPATFTLAPVFGRQEAYAGKDGAILLGEVDGAAAAVAAMELRGGVMEVDEFAVSPRFRGHGLGGSLMRAVITEARRRGATAVRARAPAWCPEWRAFYTRLGFAYTDPATRDTMTDMTPVELSLA
jgi:GNAT superfamily N-acetyltransferase